MKHLPDPVVKHSGVTYGPAIRKLDLMFKPTFLQLLFLRFNGFISLPWHTACHTVVAKCSNFSCQQAA